MDHLYQYNPPAEIDPKFRALYPEMNEEELRETYTFFHRYIGLMVRVYERMERDTK